MRGLNSILVSLFLVSFPGILQARSNRLSQIPNGERNNCLTCHTTEMGGRSQQETQSDLNPFGLEVWNDFLSSQDINGIVQWNSDLAELDSDGDGATNGEELQDPAGVWRSGQATPGDRDLVTLPGSASSFPNRLPYLPKSNLYRVLRES